MNILPFFLQVAALASAIFAAFNLWPSSRVNWGWLALALWFLSFMIAGIGLHPASAVH